MMGDDVPHKDPAVYAAYQRRYQNARQHKLKADWIHSQGGKCAKCGSKDKLEVDHKDRTSKESHRIWSWSAARRVIELLKCWVLCHECHLTKTMEENRVDPTYRRSYEREVYVGR